MRALSLLAGRFSKEEKEPQRLLAEIEPDVFLNNPGEGDHGRVAARHQTSPGSRAAPCPADLRPASR
jgi:hypothetical protein